MTTAIRRRARASRRRRRAAVGWGIAGLVAVYVAARTWPGYSLIAAGILGVVTVVWAARRTWRWLRLHTLARYIPTDINAYLAASPAEFEQMIGRLCARDGCTRVQAGGGANDLAADVKAQLPGGGLLVIQAKHYQGNVGSEELQQVGGTARPVHGAKVAAVVTTALGFTRAATAYARHPNINITLYGRDKLAAWASGTGPPPWA